MSWTTVFLVVNVFIMFLADVMLVIVCVIESKPVDTFHRCVVCMCVCVLANLLRVRTPNIIPKCKNVVTYDQKFNAYVIFLCE